MQKKSVNLLEIKFVQNEEIKNITSYHTAGTVKGVFYPKDNRELIFIYNFLSVNNIPFKILGRGSNILISRKGEKLLYISTKNICDNIRIKDIFCTVNASCPIIKVYQKCLAKSLSGFEYLAGIPGSIGGAIVMNGGAFGVNIFDNLIYIKVLQNGKIIKLGKEQIEYAYRTSSLKNCLILSAKFKLSKKDKCSIQKSFLECCAFRALKQPKGYSCGSVFKNPDDASAGYLIEQCGLKGKEQGDALISQKHANFIINKQNASASDILYLINLCEIEVYQKFGIRLKREVKVF